jgi:hypothetical protein
MDFYSHQYELNVHVLLPILTYVLNCPQTKEKELVAAEPALKARVNCCTSIAAILGLDILK